MIPLPRCPDLKHVPVLSCELLHLSPTRLLHSLSPHHRPQPPGYACFPPSDHLIRLLGYAEGAKGRALRRAPSPWEALGKPRAHLLLTSCSPRSPSLPPSPPTPPSAHNPHPLRTPALPSAVGSGTVLLPARFPAAQRGPLLQVLPDVEYLENIPIRKCLSSRCPRKGPGQGFRSGNPRPRESP